MTDSKTPIAVVSGATGNLGSNVIGAFEDAGYQCIGLDRVLPASPSGSTKWFELDATSERSVQGVFARIREEVGHPAVVVQTVGTWAMSPLLETTLADWERMMAINLTSTFLVFREAVRVMGTSGGRLIGIASGQGADKGVAQQAAYSASKGGLIRLMESVADEYAGTGITAHAIAPSLIKADDSDGKGVSVSDLASLCVYLASDAGAALNGAVVRAYG